MDRGPALVLTLLVGGLVAFQPPANAALARYVGDVGATWVSVTISFVIISVILLGFTDIGELEGLRSFRPEHALGGIAGAAIVFVSLITVRTLGAAGVAAALVAGQLIVGVLADRAAVLGLEGAALTPARLAGVALLIAGTLLVTAR